MSTSILYHAFGLRGIEHKATHFVADRIIFSGIDEFSLDFSTISITA